APLPRRRPWRTTVTGRSARQSAVPSVEPSSTTITHGRWARVWVTTSRIRRASLSAGITTAVVRGSAMGQSDAQPVAAVPKGHAGGAGGDRFQQGQGRGHGVAGGDVGRGRGRAAGAAAFQGDAQAVI